ncbi:MAG: FAD-binding monooxygenase, partial [Pseudorhodobacter sp.]|nr:FAD-binding monooxygenase [Pseudorhodobacter sp.]
LADALGRHPHDVAAAFADYDADLRPYIDEVQDDAVTFGLAMFCPTTAEALVARNQQLTAMTAA